MRLIIVVSSGRPYVTGRQQERECDNDKGAGLGYLLCFTYLFILHPLRGQCLFYSSGL